jgi:mannose-6-phosphate isomerase-like protein (cupin superfamily)
VARPITGAQPEAAAGLAALDLRGMGLVGSSDGHIAVMPDESELCELPNMWNRSRPHDRRERLFGGSGAVLVWSLCNSGPRPPFGAILACELEGAGSVGAHLQQEFAEVLIVVEGEGVARVGGSAMIMQPGVAFEIPLGQTLAFENASPERPLRYLIVKAK